MDCGTSMVKYILFIFNTLVSILGILALVYGVLDLERIGVVKIENEIGFPPQAALAMGLITIGSIVVLISFLGCCGAIREDVCMTMCYATFMLVLLILQMILLTLLWINKDEIIAGGRAAIDQTWKRSKNEPALFESIQNVFHCCGADGPSDYVLSLELPPTSCCPAGALCTPGNYYEGCKKKFTSFMSYSSDKVKYFGLGLIGIELLGFIFACCLANNIRNYKRRNAY